MRPKTSVRQPIIAAARPRHLSDLLRRWRRQPRKRSPLLFGTLLILALLIDTSLFLLGVRLVNDNESTPAPPPDRHMHVRYAADSSLWEPLRHWVIRVDGRPTLFESFCRNAVRDITGGERFEDHDPVPVVVSWMLDDGAETENWDDYPFIRCEDAELRAILYGEGSNSSRMERAEQQHGSHVEPAVARRCQAFYKLLRGVALKNAAGKWFQLTSLERQAIELRDRLALFERIHSTGVDGGDGAEMETAWAALREEYASGVNDLFSVAVADFLGASRRTLRWDDDPAVSRQLACAGWLNSYGAMEAPLYGSVAVSALFAAASLVGWRRPSWRRVLVLLGWLACAGCLLWSVAILFCRFMQNTGPFLSEGTDLLLWASGLALGWSFVLARRGRDAFLSLCGAVVSALGFFLAYCETSNLGLSWFAPASEAACDVGVSVQRALLASAFAFLALAWGTAALTLARSLVHSPSAERLRELATRCVGPIRFAAALLAASTLLDGVRALLLGVSWRYTKVQAVGTLFVLPACVGLLYARGKGWLQPFALLMAVIMIFPLLSLMEPIASWMEMENASVAWSLAMHPWLCAAGLLNLSLVVHAALRYYFGRQSSKHFV